MKKYAIVALTVLAVFVLATSTVQAQKTGDQMANEILEGPRVQTFTSSPGDTPLNGASFMSQEINELKKDVSKLSGKVKTLKDKNLTNETKIAGHDTRIKNLEGITEELTSSNNTLVAWMQKNDPRIRTLDSDVKGTKEKITISDHSIKELWQRMTYIFIAFLICVVAFAFLFYRSLRHAT